MNAISSPMAGAAAAQTFPALLRRMTYVAPGILALDFEAEDGSGLPPFEPGSHVDLHLPDGSVRQYSLCGDPADRTTYRIAVRDVKGGRASRFVHRGELRPGVVVTLGLPRNNFAFDAAANYLFVAGGIGITPLLPMMRAATQAGARWTLLLCAPRSADAPFIREARALGGEVSVHASEEGTRLDVAERLRDAPSDTLLYCCGPERLMLAVEEATSHWPEGSVRFEWFTARARPEGEVSDTFEVECAQAGITLTVPEDRTVLQVLNDAGLSVPCSCEQGVCGTCEVPVLEGEVDHRDSILSASERAANTTMMTCVSRAKSSRLVLDL
ncbi:PDR/VanB family oxidoreductase [Roseomonas populi]|uniref:PDR/VanB family oxidoreductase n=1 Tax=Roseomonas populi TaxID=3121582 RepID=A0ABT1X3K8_9PROT|nr:PDR/VanB family oxidoreductase [Roseomonas pecuniae]MCR0982694.1 PDR/VanB family oxidoreductase [Roseomonas pecuniae]